MKILNLSKLKVLFIILASFISLIANDQCLTRHDAIRVKRQQDIGTLLGFTAGGLMMTGVNYAEPWNLDGELNNSEVYILSGFGVMGIVALLHNSESPLNLSLELSADPAYIDNLELKFITYLERLSLNLSFETGKNFYNYTLGAGYKIRDKKIKIEPGGKLGIANSKPSLAFYVKEYLQILKRLHLIIYQELDINALGNYYENRLGLTYNLIK